ncbi:hypothetical protein NITMOv2_1494 [Nitrospira moscoviensis]|uniref:Uncharacterized protein n=1 Tax=Nitrospira moscoviensis TaxID=42253 RepID=A0A0K2GAF9_NITMO|nr:hypothetical protein NITMOv2_1494 [Nitrospira moscoviensis]
MQGPPQGVALGNCLVDAAAEWIQ